MTVDVIRLHTSTTLIRTVRFRQVQHDKTLITSHNITTCFGTNCHQGADLFCLKGTVTATHVFGKRS